MKLPFPTLQLCHSHFCHSLNFRFVAVMLVALSWSNPAFCDWIHYYAEKGNVAKVTALLKGNPKLALSKEENDGLTPLHYAAAGGHNAVAQLLLSHKADVNAKTKNGATPLHSAANMGRTKMAALLLAHKANINATNSAGQTPLNVAVQSLNIDTAKWLVAHKAKFTIFDVAACGDLEKVKALLKSNRNLVFSKEPNTSDTLLHIAALNGHIDVAKLLLSLKAKVNARGDGGWTPLHSAAHGGNSDVAKLLLDQKAGVNPKDNNGRTPLHVTTAANKVAMARLLLSHHADVKAETDEGKTPLYLAVEFGRKEITLLLIKHKANVNKAELYYDWTPLHRAAFEGHKEIAALLIANKANINAKDQNNCTPLRGAVDSHHLDIARLFLAHKAKFTIFEVAVCGDLEKVKLLVKTNPRLVFDTDRKVRPHSNMRHEKATGILCDCYWLTKPMSMRKLFIQRRYIWQQERGT